MKDVKSVENINIIRYADDTTLIADSEKKLQDIAESDKLGSSIYIKINGMVVTKKKGVPVCH